MAQRTVVRQGSIVYLFADNVWYQYDERSEPLGEGAMGVVYIGLACNTGDKVAIKKVRDRFANVPSIRQRAQLEANLMFRHRNLVEMIGYCEETPGYGPIYIVSKLVRGITIDQFIKQSVKTTPDRVKRICEMFYPVLDALDYIHSRNIIHMDIKPSNIMIENGSNVRLMDLGIAHVHEKTGRSDGSTGYGSGLMGTPKYAAPEQFEQGGNGAPKLGRYTDVYEAGVTLYELLTGDNPFASKDIKTALQKRKSIILPKTNEISEPVLKVLRKATSYYITDRYQSSKEMKLALMEAVQKKTLSVYAIAAICCSAVTLFIIILLIVSKWIS